MRGASIAEEEGVDGEARVNERPHAVRHPGLKARAANRKPLSVRAQSFHTHTLVTAIPDDPLCKKAGRGKH